MIKVLEFKARIEPISRVLIEFARHHPLSAIQDCSHYLQLASYWFQGAADYLYQAQMSDELAHSENERGVIIPTPEEVLRGDARTQMIFMFDKLNELEREAFEFSQSYGMEKQPRFYLESAIQRTTEAKFQIVLAGIQYERLQSIGGPNLLRP